MTSLKGFEFTVDRTGAPAFLDSADTISFRKASGEYNAPDQVSAMVRVIGPGVIADVELINIEGVQWETNFLSGEWQLSDPGNSFNPAVLFHPETGIQAALANDLVDIILLGFDELEEVPGLPLLAFTAVLEGDRANKVTFGMIDAEPLEVKMWIDPRTYDLHRLMIIDPMDEGEEEDTIWQLDFWNFDRTFEIEPPMIAEE
jgi:hypothetical protein